MKSISPKPTIVLALVSTFLFLTGCASTSHQANIVEIERKASESAILLMPVDVELSILTAGGVSEPHAQWTQAAKRYLNQSIREFLQNHDLVLTEYRRPDESDPQYQNLIELERLHGAVGKAIIAHKYGLPLPSKKGVFDWTLGKTAKGFQKQDDRSDYALFVHIRDSYSSTGRVLVQFGAALFGVSVHGGQQVGFASLVNLNTGDLVWFNYLVNPAGDMRTEEPAKDTVKHLLDNFPV